MMIPPTSIPGEAASHNIVDPARVESLLREDATVIDCVVRWQSSVDGSRDLVAYIVSAGGYSAEALRGRLAELLPPACLPTVWVRLARIPLTVDGHIDEDALREVEVIDDELMHRCEAVVKSQFSGERVHIALEENTRPAKPFHLSDLVPGWKLEVANPSSREGNSQQGVPAAAPGRMAWSDGGALNIPEGAPATLSEAFLRTARECPDKGLTYVSPGGVEVFESYASILERAERILTGLRGCGLKPKDSVILQIRSLQDHFAAFWACVLGGIHPVTVAVPPSYDANNAVVMKLHNTWELLGRPPIVANSALAGSIGDVGALLAASQFQVLKVEELEKQTRAAELFQAQPHDVVFYQLTSGSTGTPKCIQETHRGILHHVYGSADFNGYTVNDVTLNWLPMDHVVPILTCHLKDVVLGCQEIQVKTEAIIAEPLLWLQLMERHRVTHTWAPNFGFKLVSDALAGTPKRFDLSSVKYFMNAGEQVTLPVVTDFLKSVEPFGVPVRAMQPSFGMAEACTCMTYHNDFDVETGVHWILKSSLAGPLFKTAQHDGDAIPFVDLGPPMRGVQIRITDAANCVVPEGVIGRFQIKGAVITPGYLHNDKANREAFVGDGWFNSGDLGFILDGRLTLTGREKEMIIIRGANFYCYEIEDIVNRVEGVEATFAAACSVEDASGSEGLAVFFVPRTDSLAERVRMVRAVRTAVASGLGITPSYVVPVTKREFPKTTSGKIQRGQLKQSLAAGQHEQTLKEIDLELGNANTLPGWFFRTVWRRREFADVENGASACGDVLLFDDGSDLAAELGRIIDRAEQRLVRVRAGSGFSRLESREYCIDPGSSEDYRHLLMSLALDGIEPSRILHTWTCSLDEPVSDARIQENLLNRGIYSLVHLVKALNERSGAGTGKRLVVISRNSQAVTASERIVSENAMAAGIARTIGQEVPWLTCKHLDVPDAAAGYARLIIREMLSNCNEPEIAFRGSNRWVPRLCRADLSQAANCQAPFKTGGMYLITGAAGGIGGEIASYLVRQVKARVLAVGRRDAADVSIPDQLRRMPEMFRYAAVDVTDADSLQRTVTQVRQEWDCKLDGIIHLAAAYHERRLVDETRESIEEILRPKVHGTAALHQLLDDPEAIFVHFSSVTNLFGGAMIGAYAAANRFLDAFAHQQRSAYGVRSYCFDWSTWNDIGLSRGYQGIEALRARGYQAIGVRQGIQSMLAGLCRAPGNLIVGLDDTKAFLRQYSEIQPVQASKLVALVEENQTGIGEVEVSDKFGTPVRCEIRVSAAIQNLSATPETSSRTDIERRLAALWKELLHLDSVSINDNFFELGGNSLLLAKLESRMQQEFGKTATMVEMFRYPTIAALARTLSGSEQDLQSVTTNSRERAESRRTRTRRRDQSIGQETK